MNLLGLASLLGIWRREGSKRQMADGRAELGTGLQNLLPVRSQVYLMIY